MKSELIDFFKRAEDRTTLSQIILPFCSDTSGERAPVALLTGNINLKTSLKRNGQPLVFEEELKRLEAEMTDIKLSKGNIGQVIDLSAEIKRLELENDGEVDEKDIEIKEDWTEMDEILIRQRLERKPITTSMPKTNSVKKSLPLEVDIDELLRLAELEEERTNLNTNIAPSKIKEIIREVKEEIVKPKSFNSKLNLPKMTASNPLVGDVIERNSEPFNNLNESGGSEPLKKSSRFSLRKQQQEEEYE